MDGLVVMAPGRPETRELLEGYFDRLWPICRSITGNGFRDSLAILRELIPLEVHEVPSGTQVFDWTIPKEWNIREAYIVGPDGRKIADFKTNNLHVVNYSTPVNAVMQFDELCPHLHTLPNQPDAIPYVTSYYREEWGFCMDHRTFTSLPRQGDYRVYIDSTLEAGSLTYGDLVLPGSTKDEILFSTYLCHPSMANNELSGPLVTAFLYQRLNAMTERKFTYRFVFVPETIGAIAYLAENGNRMKERVRAGYVLTCVGDAAPYTYKRSRRGNSLADRAAEYVLNCSHAYSVRVLDYFPYGSDERQYCSPGFDLPVGSIMRSMYGTFPEYHTSLDNREFIDFDSMLNTVNTYYEVCNLLEKDLVYKNTVMDCEPQLGRRNLYPSLGGAAGDRSVLLDMLWILNYSDGNHSLLDIALKSEVGFDRLAKAAEILLSAGLLARV